ncbi:MAG: glycosyltransferase [Spirochaetaceae bacterium]
MRLHIGQFNDSYRPIMDGVGVCMENYAYWIQLNHGQATVVAPESPAYRDRAVFDVLRFRAVPLPKMRPFRVGVPWLDYKFMRRFRGLDFSLVHAHCPFVSGRLAAGVARRTGIPLVATFHSKYRDDFLTVSGSPTISEMGVRYVVRFYGSATEVWAPNRATARILRSYGFKGPIDVIPNGTDLEAPTAEEKERMRRRGREQIGAGASELPVYLFVGQHRWEKNVELVIRSLRQLKRRGLPFRMVFAGTGYAERAMKRMCRNEGIDDRVVFLGLILDRERLKELYAAADVLLFPSLYDNAPLVMREAAGFSVPTVVVRGASASEGVTDEENGFLVENSPESLVACLSRLAAHPEMAARVGEGARSMVYLHWRDVVAEVYARYRDIVALGRRSSANIDRSPAAW